MTTVCQTFLDVRFDVSPADGLVAEVSLEALVADALHGALAGAVDALGKDLALLAKFAEPAGVAAET